METNKIIRRNFQIVWWGLTNFKNWHLGVSSWPKNFKVPIFRSVWIGCIEIRKYTKISNIKS